MAVKSPGGSWRPFLGHEQLQVSDLIVVSGSPMRLEQFSQQQSF
ncbi:hypothetical protein [Corynebacterium urogenitale]|nr:hypothetical protein [Corynebacterium urogenitale]